MTQPVPVKGPMALRQDIQLAAGGLHSSVQLLQLTEPATLVPAWMVGVGDWVSG